MPSRQNDHPAATVRLADDQFEELVKLLTPGYECARLMLQEQRAAAEKHADDNAKVVHADGKPWTPDAA